MISCEKDEVFDRGLGFEKRSTGLASRTHFNGRLSNWEHSILYDWCFPKMPERPFSFRVQISTRLFQLRYNCTSLCKLYRKNKCGHLNLSRFWNHRVNMLSELQWGKLSRLIRERFFPLWRCDLYAHVLLVWTCLNGKEESCCWWWWFAVGRKAPRGADCSPG